MWDSCSRINNLRGRIKPGTIIVMMDIDTNVECHYSIASEYDSSTPFTCFIAKKKKKRHLPTLPPFLQLYATLEYLAIQRKYDGLDDNSKPSVANPGDVIAIIPWKQRYPGKWIDSVYG